MMEKVILKNLKELEVARRVSARDNFKSNLEKTLLNMHAASYPTKNLKSPARVRSGKFLPRFLLNAPLFSMVLGCCVIFSTTTVGAYIGVPEVRRVIDNFANVSTTGELAIQTNPAGASVKANGIDLGLTPIIKSLDAGNYNLEISLPGYETLSQNVIIPRSGRVDFALELKSILGEILNTFTEIENKNQGYKIKIPNDFNFDIQYNPSNPVDHEGYQEVLKLKPLQSNFNFSGLAQTEPLIKIYVSKALLEQATFSDLEKQIWSAENPIETLDLLLNLDRDKMTEVLALLSAKGITANTLITLDSNDSDGNDQFIVRAENNSKPLTLFNLSVKLSTNNVQELTKAVYSSQTFYYDYQLDQNLPAFSYELPRLPLVNANPAGNLNILLDNNGDGFGLEDGQFKPLALSGELLSYDGNSARSIVVNSKDELFISDGNTVHKLDGPSLQEYKNTEINFNNIEFSEDSKVVAYKRTTNQKSELVIVDLVNGKNNVVSLNASLAIVQLQPENDGLFLLTKQSESQLLQLTRYNYSSLAIPVAMGTFASTDPADQIVDLGLLDDNLFFLLKNQANIFVAPAAASNPNLQTRQTVAELLDASRLIGIRNSKIYFFQIDGRNVRLIAHKNGSLENELEFRLPEGITTGSIKLLL